MDFHDTKVLLHELEQLYLRDDDIKDMLDIRKMQREIEVQCELKLKDAKEIIKGGASTLDIALRQILLTQSL